MQLLTFTKNEIRHIMFKYSMKNEKMCSAKSALVSFGADDILAHAKACSSLVKMSKAFHTVRVPQPFDLRHFYFYRKVNTLKLWKCGLYFGSDVLQLLLRDFFIILSWFLAGFCSVLKNVPGIQRPFGQLPSRIRKENTFKTR